MPINDKQRAFINEYLINGHNATQAYKKAYPKVKWGWDKLCARLMGNDGIRAEIDRKIALLEVKTERTAQSLDQMYQKAYDLAENESIPAAMNQAVTGIARLYGMDKDNDAQTEQQRELTEAEKAEADEYTAYKAEKAIRKAREAIRIA